MIVILAAPIGASMARTNSKIFAWVAEDGRGGVFMGAFHRAAGDGERPRVERRREEG